MFRYLTRLWCTLLAAAVLLPVATIAYAEEGGRRIEEVIVTAERKEASIQDTSISITAFTDQFLDDFGIRNQEDLQNFVPATTIQPYDATIRGVGRNFRALGGDPGVATYMNNIYSEDLLTATAATFWDVERVEVLRGPQGTLYGRNAVGGAINILYKEPTDEFEGAIKAIVGNFGTEEYYGAFGGPLVEGKLYGRVNFSYRDRDGVVEEIGLRSLDGSKGPDLDGLGTENIAIQLRWTPTDTIEVNIRQNWMDIDRVFGGANGGGLTVLNEEGFAARNTTDLVGGYRFIDTNNTALANFDQNDWYDTSRAILNFTDPVTGAITQAQHNRPGIDYFDGDGRQNAAASLDGFNFTSAETAARYNECVYGDSSIDGDDLCAATNGLNNETFEQQGTQFNISWDVSDTLQLKYLFGANDLTYERITDDDNTGSQFNDLQFYVNHEATYFSHELQAFWDISDTVSITSGVFWYDAEIDQRGDFYSANNERKRIDAYEDNTALTQAGSDGIAAAVPGLVLPVGTPASALLGAGNPMATLFSARESCQVANPAPSCAENYSVKNSNEDLAAAGLGRNDNLYLSNWLGDDGTNGGLNVIHGPNTLGSDLMYTTKTEREAFAAYTQGVWDINEIFTLTLGIRYAFDDVEAEENLYRYSESNLGGLLAFWGSHADVNRLNGGLVDDGTGALNEATPLVTNGGIPFALSVYRPFQRKDEKVTGRINLDWNVNDQAMMYFSVTSGYRSGGYNLVFFSQSPTYDPEELIAYEIGYKTQWLDDTLQLNGSFYYYDYDTIHTVATEVSSLGGTSTSVLEAPGAEIMGIEAELVWLATDNLTLGGNFSFTPSEYTESLLIRDPARADVPPSLFPDAADLLEDIDGNQVLQVPEGKATGWASYRWPLAGGASVEVFGVYSWIDEVYYSPFEREEEKADDYARLDLRATWTSADGTWVATAFVNNVLDEIGNLQILREGEDEFFRHTSGTTVPRMYGAEFTYKMGNY